MRKGLTTLIAAVAAALVLVYASAAAYGADTPTGGSTPPAPTGGVPLSVADDRETQTATINKPNEYQDVLENKIWTIVFSEEIDQTDPPLIYVGKDPLGAVRAPTVVSILPQFNNMVSVAPLTEWEAGATYYLFVGALKSKTGKTLSETMQIVFTIRKQPVEQLLSSANTSLVQMKLPEAIETSEEVKQAAPQDYRGPLLEGMAYMPFDKEKALEELIQSAALNPNDSQLLFLMSFISRSQTPNGNPMLSDKLLINSVY
ncbi:MAG: hypothetical protein HPY50_07350 [Firmicutes bacterium]|nr:hypothetical protein [Bacillota bacterium]